MKYCCCIFLVFCFGKNFAQTAKEDSIAEVEIIAYRQQSYINTSNSFSIDSLQQQFFGRTDISELLQRSAPVLINNYGAGAATISIRGSNDDHTLALWNGIPLNSVSLGTMDISLLPVEAASSIKIITNAGSNVFGSGTFGGAILLDDETAWKKQQQISVRTDLASFNSYRPSLNIHLGNTKFQFRSNSFYQRSKGDFPFTDIYKVGQPLDTLEHNGLKQTATVNSLQWKINSKNILHAGNWFQWKEKEIPNIMGSYLQSSKFQKDRNIRSFIKYNHIFNHSQLQISTAHIHDILEYTDKLAPTDTFLFINSNLKANRWLNAVSYRHYLKNVRLDVATDLNFVQADVSEYGKIIREFQGAFFAGAIYNYKQLQLNATVRQEYRPGKYIRPMFGFTAQFTTKNKLYTAAVSYADKYHAPDFNDKYWTPGGNPDLLPEKGFTAELSQQVNTNRNTKNTFSSRWNIYFSRIKDEIIWKPVTALVWSPENMQSALHYGTEVQLIYRHTFSSGDMQLNVLYLYNRSTIRKNYRDNSLEGKLIAYKPEHIIKNNFEYQNQFFCAGINYIFTSQRYTDNENIEAFALKSYGLLDLYTGFTVPSNPFGVSVLARINNILNTSYQSVRSYAQQGRNITFSIILNFNKSQHNEN